jgi:hypothetical protein
MIFRWAAGIFYLITIQVDAIFISKVSLLEPLNFLSLASNEILITLIINIIRQIRAIFLLSSSMISADVE